MSIELMTSVWKFAPVKAEKLLLMLALADMANEQGFCWPSIPTLAERTRIGERAVRRLLHELTEEKLISIDARYKEDKTRLTNLYRVNAEAFPYPASQDRGTLLPKTGGPSLPKTGGPSLPKTGTPLHDHAQSVRGTIIEPSYDPLVDPLSKPNVQKWLEMPKKKNS